MYFHPHNLCDGIIHCLLTEDDERLCDANCPELCECFGHVVVCTNVFLTNDDRKRIINTVYYLQFINTTVQFPEGLIYDQLLILKCINVRLFSVTIPSTFFSQTTQLRTLHLDNVYVNSLKNLPFQKLLKVKLLYIVNNFVPIIHKYSFTGLDSLQVLFLVNLKIVKIELFAFSGLGYLKILNLSNNDITTLGDELFILSSIDSYIILDITKITLNKIAVTQTDQSILLRVSYSEICCYFKDFKNIRCQSYDNIKRRCTLLWNQRLFKCLYCCLIAFYLMFAICLIYSHIDVNKIEKLIVFNLSILNIVSALYFSNISITSYIYGQQIILYYDYLDSNLVCYMSSLALLVVPILDRLFILLKYLIYYRISKAGLHRIRESFGKHVYIIIVSWLLSVTLFSAGIHQISDFQRFPCIPFSKSLYVSTNYLILVPVSAVVINITLYLITISVGYTMVHNFKEQERTIEKLSNIHYNRTKKIRTYYLYNSIVYGILTGVQTTYVSISLLSQYESEYFHFVMFGYSALPIIYFRSWERIKYSIQRAWTKLLRK